MSIYIFFACSHVGSIGHDYTLADLEQWCSGIDPTSPVSSASPLLKNLLTSANDPSLSNEARSGIVGVVALLKEASDGKGVKVHLIIFNAVVSVKSVMSHLLVVN